MVAMTGNLFPETGTGSVGRGAGADAAPTTALVADGTTLEPRAPAAFDTVLLDFLRLQGGFTPGDGTPAGMNAVLLPGSLFSEGDGEVLPPAAETDLSANPDGPQLPLLTAAPPLHLTELENGLVLGEQGQPTGAFLRARYESEPARAQVAATMIATLPDPARVTTNLDSVQQAKQAGLAAAVADAGSEGKLNPADDTLLAQLPTFERGFSLPAMGQNHAGLAVLANSPMGGTHANVALPDIPVPVQHPAWAGQVNDRLQWMIKANLQQADIQLDPPELGRLDVRVVVNNDQANIHFASSHAVVRDALEAALPRLRDMLHDQGLTLANVDISQQSMRDERGPAEQGSGQAYGGVADDDDAASLPTASAAGAPSAHGRGLVDVFA